MFGPPTQYLLHKHNKAETSEPIPIFPRRYQHGWSNIVISHERHQIHVWEISLANLGEQLLEHSRNQYTMSLSTFHVAMYSILGMNHLSMRVISLAGRSGSVTAEISSRLRNQGLKTVSFLHIFLLQRLSKHIFRDWNVTAWYLQIILKSVLKSAQRSSDFDISTLAEKIMPDFNRMDVVLH
jgi:hypothetical protein